MIDGYILGICLKEQCLVFLENLPNFAAKAESWIFLSSFTDPIFSELKLFQERKKALENPTPSSPQSLETQKNNKKLQMR